MGLSVPGLAEGRPSLLIGDRLIVSVRGKCWNGEREGEREGETEGGRREGGERENELYLNTEFHQEIYLVYTKAVREYIH